MFFIRKILKISEKYLKKWICMQPLIGNQEGTPFSLFHHSVEASPSQLFQLAGNNLHIWTFPPIIRSLCVQET